MSKLPDISFLGDNLCPWCKERIDAGTQSPGQLCYIQYEEGVLAWMTGPDDHKDNHTTRHLDEKHFKEKAVLRQEFWKDKSEDVNGVNKFAECDAQYLGK